MKIPVSIPVISWTNYPPLIAVSVNSLTSMLIYSLPACTDSHRSPATTTFWYGFVNFTIINWMTASYSLNLWSAVTSLGSVLLVSLIWDSLVQGFSVARYRLFLRDLGLRGPRPRRLAARHFAVLPAGPFAPSMAVGLFDLWGKENNQNSMEARSTWICPGTKQGQHLLLK